MNKNLILLSNLDKVKSMDLQLIESTIGNILNLLYEDDHGSENNDCCTELVIDILHELLASLHIAINSHPIGNYRERIINEISLLSDVPNTCMLDTASACAKLSIRRETARSIYEGLIHELRLMGIGSRTI
ncbi:MAG: hypothetical protein RXO22_07305 [Thermocladium sp.]|jgi:hypothetical protein|nr:MAG: hypothetical protein AT710_01670 [Thermocladium sp. ECH_B]